jgi:hypothetical protein
LANLPSLGNPGLERSLSRAAAERDEIAVLDATVFGVHRMYLQEVFGMPHIVVGSPCLGTHGEAAAP